MNGRLRAEFTDSDNVYAVRIQAILKRFHHDIQRVSQLKRLISELEGLPMPDDSLWRAYYIAQLKEYREELFELKARL